MRFCIFFLFAQTFLLAASEDPINNAFALLSSNEYIDENSFFCCLEKRDHPLVETLQVDVDDSSTWLDKEKLAVSLGYNCIVAGQLYNEKIRYKTFPFDWCESSMEGVIRCINNDFRDFLCKDNLRHDAHIRVTDSLYNITVVHDFPFQQIAGFSFPTISKYYSFSKPLDLIYDQHEVLYAKFMRRIKRFRQLAAFKGKLYFIRCMDITKQQTMRLFEALQVLFNNNDFTLVVINDTEEFKHDWGLLRIKNFFVPELINKTFAEGLFADIFKIVGLLD